MKNDAAILIVDDSPEVLHSLVALLSSEYKVFIAKSGKQALEQLEKHSIDLILLDISLPDISGIEVCRLVKKTEDLLELPIIFITAETDPKVETIGLEAGAVDFISKPVNPAIVKARVATHLFNYEQKKRLSEEFKSLSRLNENIVETAPEGIAYINNSGEIQVWNRVLEKSTFLSIKQVTLEKLLKILPSYIRDAVEDALKGKSGIVTIDKFQLLVENGVYSYYSLTVSPLFDEGTFTGTILLLRDITDQITSELEKKDLEEKLQHAQKLEAIGTLAGGIAHDFNNMLAAIMGFSEIGLDDYKDDSQASEYFKQILNASERAKELTSQILIFSRKSDLKQEKFQLSPFMLDTIKFLKATIPTSVHITADIDCDNDMLECSPTHINQLIMNLCVNASHAIGSSEGEITIRIRPLTDQPLAPHIQQRLQQNKQYLLLEISDTGCGMSKEVLDRVFEPFFTTKDVGVGTGMGLSMVHGITQKLHGAIDVTSVVNKGTTFSVYLPVIEQIKGDLHNTTEHFAKGVGRILVVDDEENIAKIMQKMLETNGYTVTAITDPLKALDQVHEGDFNLVITDKNMPGITGIHLARNVHGSNPDLPILMTTGYRNPLDDSTLEQYGISGVIPKPFNRDILLRLVSQTIRTN